MSRVVNINTSGNAFLIHVFNNQLSMRDVYCFSQRELDEKVTELLDDPEVYDFIIYQRIDFDLEEK